MVLTKTLIKGFLCLYLSKGGRYKMCNCKVTEIIVAVIILLFAFYETIYSKWVIVIAAAVLLVHGLGCKNIAGCCEEAKPRAKRKR